MDKPNWRRALPGGKEALFQPRLEHIRGSVGVIGVGVPPKPMILKPMMRISSRRNPSDGVIAKRKAAVMANISVPCTTRLNDASGMSMRTVPFALIVAVTVPRQNKDIHDLDRDAAGENLYIFARGKGHGDVGAASVDRLSNCLTRVIDLDTHRACNDQPR